ncbi:MAG: cadherin repeat domain-containing protein [Pseudomonadota bacterium]
MRGMDTMGLQLVPRQVSGSFIGISGTSPAEDAPAGTVIGTPFVSNTPAGTTYAFTVIDNPTGLVTFTGGQFETAGALDFETDNPIPVTIRATPTPAGDVIEQTVLISIINVLEVTLVDLALSNTTVAEDIAPGALIATISNISTAPPATSVVTLSDDAGGRFAIASNNQLVAGLVPFDFESATSHDITLLETHLDAVPRETDFTITVTNVLEVTLNALSLSSASAAEDATVGTIVGTVGNTTSGGTVSLTDDAGGLFALSNGAVVTAATLDFETATSHDITLRETHPDATARNTTLTITVTDVQEGAWQVTAGDGSLTVVTSPTPPSKPTAVAGDGSITVSS